MANDAKAVIKDTSAEEATTHAEDLGTMYDEQVTGTDAIAVWANKTGTSNKEYATLLFEAETLGLITINHKITRRTLNEVKDEKTITGTSYNKDSTDLYIFYTTWRMIQNWTKKWIKAGRKGVQPNIVMGSMTHYDSGVLRGTRHGKAQALDVNGMEFAATDSNAVDEVISIIDGLPPGVHVIGLPLQGQFFKSDDYIGNVINTVTTDDAVGLAFHTTTTRKLTKENGVWPEQRPKSPAYHKQFKVNGTWINDSKLPAGGTKAIDLLQSTKLKEKIELINKRTNTSLDVMPDYNNHLHIQTNSLKK
jgi:hypothetical protein